MHELGLCIRVDIYVAYMLYEWLLSNNTSVSIYVVPKERIRTVNLLQGKLNFLANKTIKVNPNGGKQGGIPEKESLGIANPKSNPNGLQTKLVPRRRGKIPTRISAEVIPMYQQKQRGIPKENLL